MKNRIEMENPVMKRIQIGQGRNLGLGNGTSNFKWNNKLSPEEQQVLNDIIQSSDEE